MIRLEHVGDTGFAFSDVMDFVVSRIEDLVGSTVVVNIPDVGENDSEHLYTSFGRF